MNGFLLDTDTISLAQFGHAIVVARLAARNDSEIFLSVISLQEQMAGWLGRFNKLKTPDKIAEWYDRFVVRMFPIWRPYEMRSFCLAAVQRFESLRKQRLNIGLMDLRIASIGLESGLTVVTRNTADFSRVPGLNVEDWSI